MRGLSVAYSDALPFASIDATACASEVYRS
jgi:hypothetical protein